MDPHNFRPGLGMPFPGWMPPSGTPFPPGMAGPPPPGWLPIPPPPPPLGQNNSPHFIPMAGPPPGMPFHLNPFPHQQQQQQGRPFLPLGAIPPPPQPPLVMPNSAPPIALLPPGPDPVLTGSTATTTAGLGDELNYNRESVIPASPALSQNNGQEFTPPARRSMQSRAQSAGTRSPRARTASSGPASFSFGTEKSSFGGNQASRTPRNGPGNNSGSGGFGSYGPKSTSSSFPAHSRPQSGSASRNSPKRVSSIQPARRAGSGRPRSAANFCGPAFSSSAASASVSSHMPIDDSDNIKVAIRIRPLNPTETARGDACMLQVSQESPQQVILTVPASATTAPSSSHWLGPNNAVLQPTTKTFQFHSCIGPESGQEDVIRLCGITQLLDAALDGYNATILAYGQTGSGKTYTIVGHEDVDESAANNSFLPGSTFGSGDDEGIVSRSLAYIFRQVEARNAAAAAGTAGEGDLASNGSIGAGDGPSHATTITGDGCKYSIRASYSEIYNEALYDLLCFDQRQLSLRWDPVKGFHAPDLTLQECATLQDAQEVVVCGLRHRRVGSHSLNLESSRSHAILTVHIDAAPVRPEAADFGSTRMGKVVFVDLAGSERLKDSHSEGIAMRETASINCSLFMLGKVISCLASGAKGSVVPYRESKLTKLLMDSLGGSALSLMIACCSPSSAHLEETLSTLSYATRAKNIKKRTCSANGPSAGCFSCFAERNKSIKS
ncbi:hypothetical protein KSW81_005397 [Nannochloris sp. 'desiccata']|nr:hypothetical protein KSW81_005397 [Chlorella desiccata (nom. nud.)]